MVELVPPTRMWHCPACDLRDETRKPGVHTQFHNCRANGGLGIPMIEVRNHRSDADARHVARTDRNVVAAISTEHASGRVDCTVFPAPAALILKGH